MSYKIKGDVDVGRDLDVANDITVAGTVDGRDIDTDGTKLDNIEDNATADQSDAEIKTAYENNADTNEFSDAEQTKLGAIEALADVTDATNVEAAGAVMETDISGTPSGSIIDDDTMSTASDTKLSTSESTKAYIDGVVSSSVNYRGGYNANTNVPALDTGSPNLIIGDMYTVTDAGTFFTVLLEIGDVLIAEVTSSDAADIGDWTIVQKNLDAASIKVAYESNADTNAFTDNDENKLDGIATNANLYVHPNHTGDVTSTGDGAQVIADDAVTYSKIQNIVNDERLLGNVAGSNSVVAELDQSTVLTFLGVEAGATADQTGAEIKTAYEAESNAFTDAQFTKLSNIETNANDYTHPNHTGDVTSTGDGAQVIANDAVTYTKMQNVVADERLLGNVSGAGGVVAELDQSTVLTFLGGVEAGADITDNTNVDAAGAVMDSDISEAEGFLRKTGAGAYVAHKSNLNSSSDPDANDDSNSGYAVGSTWLNTTTKNGFVLLDATVASAVWKTTTAATGTGDLVAANNLSDVANALTSTQNLGVEVGVDVQAFTSVLEATTASFLTADETKLDAIEALADVTDATNVAAALTNGVAALTSDEVTQLANINSEAISNAEWAFVATATAAFTSTLETKIDGIETSATADQSDAEIKTAYENNADTNEFSNAEQTKLGGIEALADVTDATNVESAGAVMESDISGTPSGSIIDDDTMTTASNTTLATSESTKAYIDGVVSSSVNYQGGYNAATDTPALDTGSPDITIGDMYTVTAAGSFFTETVEIGDVLIAEVTSSDAADLDDWTIVQKNLDAASIKVAYESNADTNVFDNAAETKLGGIEALADVTDATNVATALTNGVAALTSDEVTQLANINSEAISNTEWAFVATATAAFTSTLETKIDGIETAATADQTDAEIKTAYENNADTNEFSDAEQTKLAGIETAAKDDQVASEVLVDVLGSPTFDNLQEVGDIQHSAGIITGGLITDGGSGTLDVAAGTIFIKDVDSDTDTLFTADFSSVASQSLTNNDLNYVTVDYNSGTPIVVISITRPTEFNTTVLLGTVYRNASVLHISNHTAYTVANHAAKLISRFQDTDPFARTSGAVITETGTINIAVSSGNFWEGLKQFTTGAIDTSVADTFSYWYRDGGSGWTEVASSTDIDNLLYDDNSGTLATLSNGQFGLHWVYVGSDGEIDVLYGQNTYTLSNAADAPAPSTQPPHFESHSRLIGKITINKSDNVFTEIVSAFEVTLSGSSGIQSVQDDTTPTLGGDLDDGGFLIAGIDVGDIPNTFATITRSLTSEADSYTLVLGDQGDVVTMDSSSANIVTVPTNASVAYPNGTQIDIGLIGSGSGTVTGASGVTINGVSAGSATINAQWDAVTLLKLTTNTWLLMGGHGGVA